MKKRWIIPICIVLILISLVTWAVFMYGQYEQALQIGEAKAVVFFNIFFFWYTCILLINEIDIAYNICWLVLAPKPRHKLRLILNCTALLLSVCMGWIFFARFLEIELTIPYGNEVTLGIVVGYLLVRLVSLGLLAWQAMFAREHNKTQGVSRVENDRSEDA